MPYYVYINYIKNKLRFYANRNLSLVYPLGLAGKFLARYIPQPKFTNILYNYNSVTRVYNKNKNYLDYKLGAKNYKAIRKISSPLTR